MIHIATIHWKTDKWIDIQLRYLRRYIKEDYRVYAFLNGIDKKYKEHYYYTINEDIQEHYIKLNLLGEIIKLSSTNKNEDLIFFLDGDAFPIGDIVTFARNKISSNKLIAIQRRENCGDIQPHPAFCATTVGFWENINGTWKYGYKWINELGTQVSDVGGELLRILIEKKIDWLPMLRSGQLTSHPIFFGIYSNLIYHHGAGFRTPFSRYDINETSFLFGSYYKIISKLPYRIIKRITFESLFFKKNILMSHNILKEVKSLDFSFNQYL